MTRGWVHAGKDESLLDCAKKLVRKKVGCLPLTDGKKLAGFISGQDILWAIIKNPRADLSQIKAIDISPKKIITIKSSATLKEAIEKIKKFKFYRMPVVDNGDVVGLITLRDIISFYPGAHSELEELELIREEAEKIRRVRKDYDESLSSEDGACEECGSKGELYDVNGIMMCASCSSNI
ncbi:MAG: CBS domain-containing protein [Nanoarchaeota archaeon]|nr:CBS domain-containing protein [Nanoarchaeota archaeon]